MTIRLVISGRVQGVGFRWFIKQTARRLQVTGTVSNLPDGRVEIFAGGSAEALEELERIARKGPAGAHVERVEKAENVDYPDGLKAFDII
ncbi:MAG: acylphosphatase [Gemmatimonadota bacterium]